MIARFLPRTVVGLLSFVGLSPARAVEAAPLLYLPTEEFQFAGGWTKR